MEILGSLMSNDFKFYCEKELFRLKKNSNSDFFNSLKYSFFSGGKRIRPRLLLAMGEELGCRAKVLYSVAFAVELVHTYSLIHDDLPAMDNDMYRRGRLTHHAKYGEASAVLAGNGLLTFAFQILAENYRGEVLKDLILMLSKSLGALGMIGGQVLDCLTHERDEKIFNKIHLLKTGMLFGFSTASPGVILGLEKSKIDNLKRLGHIIGLLFQLQDDFFDEDKKSKRREENILSILLKTELLNLIQNKKESIQYLLRELHIKMGSTFYELIQMLFKRKY